MGGKVMTEKAVGMTDPATARRSEAAFGLQSGEPVIEFGRPLPPELLYRRCDPADLPFGLCSELEEALGLIGQERAVRLQLVPAPNRSRAKTSSCTCEHRPSGRETNCWPRQSRTT
jgi:hypothetical protein